ncbi:MAG: hypothetical protein JWR08_2507 [Enterovirga sp.]|nr:hypothetical protein [Enterovirga sp.]
MSHPRLAAEDDIEDRSLSARPCQRLMETP